MRQGWGTVSRGNTGVCRKSLAAMRKEGLSQEGCAAIMHMATISVDGQPNMGAFDAEVYKLPLKTQPLTRLNP